MRSQVSPHSVVHIVQKLAPGGIETLVLDLAKDAGSDSRIFSLEGNAHDLVQAWAALEPVAGQIEAFEAQGGLKPALVIQLVKRLRAVKPSAVFLHHVGPLVYGGLAARLAGVARIVHVEHDVWHYALPRRRVIASVIETIVRPHHVTVSNHAANTLRAMLRSPSISVIPNGIDFTRFVPGDKTAARAAFGLDPTWRIIGTVGRLVAVKGQSVLIDAIARLPADCHLVIVGSGEEHDALVSQALALSLQTRVHFIGHLNAVERLLPAFDVFCLPSHAEGFPRSIIEAQAAGLPVVATRVGAVDEAVCQASGRIVPPGDPVAMAHALRDVLSAPLTTQPRAFVADRFSWPSTLSSYRRVSEFQHAA
jgi:glycosyltransferase involved in cell wall biosynthesis